MRATIGERIVACQQQATCARILATAAETPEMRREYWALEQSWLQVADALEYAQTISGYLQWAARRLEPPPP